MLSIKSEYSQMTPELLAELITRHKGIVMGRLQKLHDAYANDYRIFHMQPKEAWKPDNRLAVNFAKYITDTFNGFFCGIPIKTSSDDEKIDGYIQLLDQYNGMDENNVELSKMADIYGLANEMYYIDEEGNIGETYVSPMQSFLVTDDSILERPMYFIRYYRDSENVERGSWSDAQVVQHFVNKGGYRWEDEPKIHGFDGVPAVEFKENEEATSIYESVLNLIDGYNKALSEKANDVDAFADAYMKVTGVKLGKDEVVRIRDDRLINLYSDDPDDGAGDLDAQFLQKPSSDETQENLIERLQKLIFQISMVADISDENFAGSVSGVSLKYKLQPMSNLAQAKELKFRAALNRRYRLIFSNPISAAQGIHADDWLKVSYTFTRNYPQNILDEAQTAAQLEGVVSKQTQLSVLSIVDDPRKEMDRMQEEEDEAVSRPTAKEQAEYPDVPAGVMNGLNNEE